MSPKVRIALGVVAALVAGLALGFGALVDWAMTPSGAFDASTAPAAPDYAADAAWSALPGREDLADRAPPGSPAVAPAEAKADVFYLHPTSYERRVRIDAPNCSSVLWPAAF